MEKHADMKFNIVLAADPKVWAGADNKDNCVVKPVITDGQMKVWSVKDGYLVLDDAWFSSYEDDKVVVRGSVKKHTIWDVIEVDDGYQIMLEGTNKVWTASALDPEKPIILAPLGSVDSVERKYQVWSLQQGA
ncbi:hypothetical protein JVT61DRAFT_8593 [Boletus reticuloceps]|uniref:Uncharacterized protein n=1 Tax=Boletus reticuloceps TaxID=495285 RepID=A0A8I3ACL1_9AGAM|nr:hypothetical protein JVT61DRAFT_8593 [Boletus reticuloceps]